MACRQEVALRTRSERRHAAASFGPDIPTCGRKENLTIPRSEDRGKGLLQAGRRGRRYFTTIRAFLEATFDEVGNRDIHGNDLEKIPDLSNGRAFICSKVRFPERIVRVSRP
jgi:hypothetical protein